MISRGRCMLIAAGFPFLFAAPARAQTDPVAAQALFDEAKHLMANGNAVAACPKLAESQRLDPGVGTLLNLGECYEQVGKPSRAWATFRDAEAMALHEGQPGRARYASARAAQVEVKLVRITVEVPDIARVASIEVLRDGELLREPLWGSAVPVDPGDHIIEARAPGYKLFSSRVTATRDPIVVRITSLEREAAVVETVSLPPTIDTTPPLTIETLPPLPVEHQHDTSATTRTIGYVTGGAGAAGLVLGAVMGVLAIDRANAANGAGCDQTTCPTTGALALSSDAKTFAVASDVGFAVGASLMVIGFVLVMVAPRTPAAHVAMHVLRGTF